MRAQRIQTGLWATRATWTERRPYLGGEDRSGAGAVVGCLAGGGGCYRAFFVHGWIEEVEDIDREIGRSGRMEGGKQVEASLNAPSLPM